MLDRRRTLRTAEELAAAGLLAPERAGIVGEVSSRYAIAVTPATVTLTPDRGAARTVQPGKRDDAIALVQSDMGPKLDRYLASIGKLVDLERASIDAVARGVEARASGARACALPA